MVNIFTRFFRTLFFKPETKTMKVKVEQGDRGRFRWMAYDGDDFRAMGNPGGHSTYNEAVTDAKEVLGAEYFVETDEGEMWTSSREFDNN